MTDKRHICFTAAIAALLISNILLTVQILAQKKSVLLLETKTASFDERLSGFMEQEKELIEGIDKGVNLILNGQKENQGEIKNELSMISRRSESQFSKTVSMGRTYDAILEEQKKKTVDTAEKDKAFLEAKKAALALYKRGDFAAASIEFKKLIEERRDDMECLLYKTKSLFYMNRADSSNYSEILDNIKILRRNAAADGECLEIEKAVLAEQGGFYE